MGDNLMDAVNSGVAAGGGVDLLVQAHQAQMSFGNGVNGLVNGLRPSSMSAAKSAMQGTKGIPGSKALGVAGTALSLYGLGNDIWDMAENGVSVDNALSAATNATGALGAVSPHAAALSMGLDLGRRGDKRLGLSDKASDLGMWADEAVGGGVPGKVAGLLGTAVGSIASVPAAAAAGIYDLGATGVSAVEGAGRSLLGLDHPLLAGVREQVAAGAGG